MKAWKKIISVIAILLILCSLGYLVTFGMIGTGKGKVENITLGLDLAGGVSITYQAQGDVSSQDMEDAINKMQQRVQEYDGAQVYKQGSDMITIEVPGADDASAVLENLGKPGSLYFINQYAEDGTTTNYEYGTYEDEDGNTLYGYHLTRTLEEITEDGSLIMEGTDIKSATAGYTSDSEPVVDFTLTDDGTKKFADATTTAAEENWSIGIYYDGEFISVPSVNSAITGGSGQISGMSSIDEAKELASNIRIGALPVELKEVSSMVVGATLGQEAISTSLFAAAIGFIFLFLFMVIYYRIPGVAAFIGLIFYTEMILLILNVFNFTLTLPGIAGMVLTIGMAMDANIVIYARIREEISAGKNVHDAIKLGFSKAFSAVFDGHVTTLIAAVALGVIGTGPVRGFALTLGIGIVLSLFTALVVARIILLLMYHCGIRNVKLYGHATERKSINFVKHTGLFIGISVVLMLVGVGFMVFHGAGGKGAFNYDLEFSGGTATSITFDKTYTLEELESDVIPVLKEATGVKNIQKQTVKGTNTVVFKTTALTEDQRDKLMEAVSSEFGVDTTDKEAFSWENISGVISNQIRRDAVLAVIASVILMLIYIWVRFKDLHFATATIIALLHDTFILIAFYAVSRISVGTTFIACVLTILGYSTNATIVIFDRMRENLHSMKKETLAEVVNTSITQTLSRSINTTVTTFISIFFLYIFGVTAIKDFAGPIMVGIVCGIFSSVCISGTIWYLMKKISYKRAVKKAQ